MFDHGCSAVILDRDNIKERLCKHKAVCESIWPGESHVRPFCLKHMQYIERVLIKLLERHRKRMNK